jgi:hypothetical protein
MKNRIISISKNILGMLVLWFITSLIGYGTYYVTFDEKILSYGNFLGIYAILLQIVIIIMVSMKNDDK